MPRKSSEIQASVSVEQSPIEQPAEKPTEAPDGLQPEKWYELMNERAVLLAKLEAKGERWLELGSKSELKGFAAASRIKRRLNKIDNQLIEMERKLGENSAGRDLQVEFYRAADNDEKFSLVLEKLQQLRQSQDEAAAQEYAVISEGKSGHQGLLKADREALQEIRQDEQRLEQEEKFLENSPSIALFFRMATLEAYRQALQGKNFVETPSRREFAERIKFHIENNEPILLEGETGTGKTELALNLCRKFYGREPEFISGSPDVRASDLMVKQGLRASESAGREKREELAQEIAEYMEKYHQAHPDATDMDMARENDNYARIVAASAGISPETYFIYGPLVRAMEEGLPLIIDEANLIEPRLRMVLKRIYNAKPGNKIPLAGDGQVIVEPGFGLIFTANLKGEKHTERFDFDEAEKRVMINSTIHIDYLPKEELYDLLLAKAMDSQGEAPISRVEAEATLKNFCDAVADIQTAYRDKPSEIYAPKDARGKQQEFKEGVLDPGAALRMLNGLETKDPSEPLTDFLNRSILNYASNRNYNPKDRGLIVKIFMSKGFLQNISAKELEIPELSDAVLKPFKAQASKKTETIPAASQQKELNRRQLAELDPYGLRKIANERIGEGFLELAGHSAEQVIFQTAESAVSADMEKAEKIMGPEKFFGPEEVKKALGIEIKPQEIPPVGFTEAELERAMELGQFLILRADKAPDGEPLTMKKIMEVKNNLMADSGKLLYNTDWYENEAFFTADRLKLSWALVSEEIISGTNDCDYLQQTEKLAEHIRSEVFKGQNMPQEYQEALDEFEREKAAIEPLIGSDWSAAAARLEQLKITQLFRRSPAEIIYDLAVVNDGQVNGKKLLRGIYDWSKRRYSDGEFVGAGGFDADVSNVYGSSPDDSYSNLGVCLSRNPSVIGKFGFLNS